METKIILNEVEFSTVMLTNSPYTACPLPQDLHSIITSTLLPFGNCDCNSGSELKHLSSPPASSIFSDDVLPLSSRSDRLCSSMCKVVAIILHNSNSSDRVF